MNVEGLIEADDCINVLSVNIGDNFVKSGVRPLVAHDVFGIVKVDGKYHFMMEDDCHFWTAAIINEKEIEDAKEAVTEIMNNISVKKNKRTKRPDWGKAKIKPNHRSLVRKGDVEVSFANVKIPLIYVRFKNQNSEVLFHPVWYNAFMRTLNLVERVPK
jgi:hypothetical protein